MNPAQALATVLVDELVRGGVRDAVLCPGSRNAPLSFALHDADAAGRLRLHVRIDERTAGFLALGLAKDSRRPVPVVTTSGTAVANLHPAVVEASYAGVPLLVLSADRPPELRGVGANQAIDQLGIFGSSVRLFHEVGAPGRCPGQNAYWRAAACRALAAAAGGPGMPGPVHLNVALRDPLVPDAASGWDAENLSGRPDGGPWVRVAAPPAASGSGPGLPARTLVVVGDTDPATAADAIAAAEQRGLPFLAEPTAARPCATLLRSGPLLLDVEPFLDRYAPEHVVVVGRPTLGRALARLLRRPGVETTVVSPRDSWADPTHAARRVVRQFGPDDDNPPQADADWLAAWLDADASVAAAVARVVRASWPSGPAVAQCVLAGIPSGALLMVGSSSPVRDLWIAGTPRADVRVVANRGAAGIDGTLSTAIGLALERGVGAPAGATYALVGDLTFLHDSNAVVIGPAEPRPALTVVVVNDDGGGIFGQLEQGAPEHAGSFERIFGTPTGVDLAPLCVATQTPHRLVRTPDELRDALAPVGGLRVVEVRADRFAARDLHALLRATAGEALGIVGPGSSARTAGRSGT